MKKLMKVFAMALCLSLVVLSLVACGGETAVEPEAGVSESKTELSIGTNAEFPPFEFVDAELGVIDEFAGIDMDIMVEIADSLGAKPVINNMDFDGLLLALMNGQVDCVISGMTITEERKQEVDFSDPYYVATQVMIVPEGSEIKTAADMEGKKIAVIDGYTGQTCVEELGFDFSGYRKGTDAILDIVNGKIDVLVIDSATAEAFIGDNEGLAIVEDAQAFAAEEYGIAVKKGNPELLDAINAKIKELKESGKMDEICAKYN